ncbi:MAG TPA: DUF99 family protein [Thermoplasmata archaeon]|nr:DUF99 family protein [Thermoplasmata archaeon]
MKLNIKTIGIDDAPFDFHNLRQRETMLVGAVMRSNHYLEGVLSTTIEIDGTDATEKVIEMVRDSRHHRQLKAIFLDGITMGGFNVLDIFRICELTGIPVLSLTRNEPDFKSIESALKTHFPDGEERWLLIKRGRLHRFKAGEKEIFGKIAGIEPEKAQELIDVTTKYGHIPEPVRVAHLIASGIVKGESTGKA